MAAAFGMSSCISCSRLVTAASPNMVIPVTLPPGRLRLATRPSLTGSPLAVNTIGIVWVAALAACGEGSPPVAAITTTCRRTKSASTLSLATGFAPRWLAIFGYILALLLLIGSYYISWSFVVFPVWVFLISFYILRDNLRRRSQVVLSG